MPKKTFTVPSAEWLTDAKAIERFRRVIRLPPASRVLLSGGSSTASAADASASADLYDPATNTFQPTADMGVARVSHVSIPVVGTARFPGLPAPATLVAGGLGPINATQTSYLASAEVYANGAFHPVGNLVVARAGAVAAATGTGRIVICGGRGLDSQGPRSAEVLLRNGATAFDDGFRLSAGAMVHERTGHTVTAVRVLGRRWAALLVAGGGDNTANRTAEIYIEQDDDFGIVQPLAMTRTRYRHAAALLNDGRVLLAGGARSAAGTDMEWNQAEVFDPQTLAFTEVGPMVEMRQGHSATVLPDGRVLIAGGSKRTGTSGGRPVNQLLAAAELFDPASGTFTRIGNLVTPRTEHTATPLGDGRVLLAGGWGAGPAALASGEVYDPRTNAFTAVGNAMSRPRVHHAAAIVG